MSSPEPFNEDCTRPLDKDGVQGPVAGGDVGGGRSMRPSPPTWQYDTGYECVPQEFAAFYSWLQRHTVERPAWMGQWQLGALEASKADGILDTDGTVISTNDLLIMRYNRHGDIYDPGDNHGNTKRFWVRYDKGEKRTLNAYVTGFAAERGFTVKEFGGVSTTKSTKSRGRPKIPDPSPATLRKRKQRKRERVLADALKEVETSLKRIENKIDHEQALNALRLGRLLREQAEAEYEDTEDA